MLPPASRYVAIYQLTPGRTDRLVVRFRCCEHLAREHFEIGQVRGCAIDGCECEEAPPGAMTQADLEAFAAENPTLGSCARHDLDALDSALRAEPEHGAIRRCTCGLDLTDGSTPHRIGCPLGDAAIGMFAEVET